MIAPARSAAVLLDTCAVIWLAQGSRIAPDAEMRIREAARAGAVFVSPVSAWEIGLLSRPRPGRVLEFLPDPATWFARFMAGPGMRPAPFNAEIAIASSLLPGSLHGDPADRLLVATARDMSVPIMTRDGPIRDYADAGHVSVVPC
ncbi:MAG: type II toxin-antitoxin system VapC family toxin [Caulobacteraceae bacterium]